MFLLITKIESFFKFVKAYKGLNERSQSSFSIADTNRVKHLTLNPSSALFLFMARLSLLLTVVTV